MDSYDTIRMYGMQMTAFFRNGVWCVGVRGPDLNGDEREVDCTGTIGEGAEHVLATAVSLFMSQMRPKPVSQIVDP